MGLNSLIFLVGFLSLLTAIVIPVITYTQKGKANLKYSLPLGGIATFMIMFQSLFYYQPAGVNTLIQYPSGKQVCFTEPGYHWKFFGDTIEMQKYISVQLKKEVRFNDSVTADAEVAVRFELSKDPDMCKETIVAFRSEEKLMTQTLMPLTQAAIRNSARLLSAQEYVSGNGGRLEQAFQDQLSEGLYILEQRRSEIADDSQEVGTKTVATDTEKKYSYIVEIKLDKNGVPLRTKRSTDQYGIIISQAEVSSIDPSPAFKKKLENQMAESARGALEREKTKALQFEKEREQAQGELDKVKRKLDAEKQQIERLVASKAKEQEAQNDLRAITIRETVERKEANIKMMQADAEAYAKKKVMLADGALEKRLDAYVESVKAMAAALTDKQLVPQVYMGGGDGKGAPNATDLVNLMTAKFARDLGIKDVPKTTN
jgi:regulator of protease activity HflC (stomatin/prohibitin superfamily)